MWTDALPAAVTARLCLLILAMTPLGGLAAPTDTPTVTLRAWLDQAGTPAAQPYAVNQQIILNLELATPGWFTAGTRIGRLELPGVMAKQRNEQATNFSQRHGEQTWSHQRWELTLYPLQSGRVEIPAIPISATVAREGGGSQTVTLLTPPLSFSASLPDPRLVPGGAWLTASELKLEQQWLGTRQQGALRVGDALTRTVRVQGRDTLSVLIPPLLSPVATPRGTSAYPQPVRLDDSQTRGEYLSEREEQTVYILQAGGEVSFPPIALTWWNSQRRQMETLRLPGQTLSVRHSPGSWLRAYWYWVASGLVSLGGLASAGWALRRYYRRRPRPLWWQYGIAVRRRNWPQARLLAYRHLGKRGGGLELGRLSAAPSWQRRQRAFQRGEPGPLAAWRLWLQLTRLLKRPSRPRRWRLPRALPGLHPPPGDGGP